MRSEGVSVNPTVRATVLFHYSYSIYLNTGHFESCHPCPYTILHRTTTKSREIKKNACCIELGCFCTMQFSPTGEVRFEVRRPQGWEGRGNIITNDLITPLECFFPHLAMESRESSYRINNIF